MVWENVPLQEGNLSKPWQIFTFGVTLYNTGDIIFAYKTIPIPIESIKDSEEHPMRIGLADAYILDKTFHGKFSICEKIVRFINERSNFFNHINNIC